MRKDIRRHPRVAFPGLLRLSWQDAGGNPKFTKGRCLDMSISGLRVEVPEAVAIRSYVIVKADTLRLTANASVRHCTRLGGKFVLGLEFSSPLDTSDPTIAEILNRAAAEPAAK